MTAPQSSTGDKVHLAARMAVSSVPVVGGPLVELFNKIIAPPLAKRRDAWIESIESDLKDVAMKIEGFDLVKLQDDPVFVTTVLHATQTALRAHQKEKLVALRNAVINSALSRAPDDDLQLMFLNFIDKFTVWHLKILDLLNDPSDYAHSRGMNFPDWHMGGVSTVIEHVFPELKGRREFYDLINKDLISSGLLMDSSLHGTMTGSGMLQSRSTAIGKKFISFISKP